MTMHAPFWQNLPLHSVASGPSAVRIARSDLLVGESDAMQRLKEQFTA